MSHSAQRSVTGCGSTPRCQPQTRIEVVTEGVLTRLLQADPALDGVGLVIFDEFHERSLQADLGLALCLDVRAGLRDDLRLLLMSATLDGEAVAELLGGAPLLTGAGRSYPVELRYLSRDLAQAGELPVAIARELPALLAERSGDVLVFLPGVGEIRRTEQRLSRTAGAGRLQTGVAVRRI